MEDAACTAVSVPDRAPRGPGAVAPCALEHGLYSAEARAEQKLARELLQQRNLELAFLPANPSWFKSVAVVDFLTATQQLGFRL